MLVWWSVVVVLCAAARSAADDDLPWWKTAIFYQIYPRSFMDSDGDGVGDLKGITHRAGYLKEAGVTAIWLSPIFKSPMADFGYDISNYRQIDPTFGTMEDFRELANTLKQLGIKLLLDLVPNHTSDEHEWFLKSVRREDPYTDYYVWQDGRVDPITNETSPPNKWISVFSGSAWEWSEARQQFYLHQFVSKQPDLNFSNPAVVKEMDDIIKFWLDQGVDGFRVDACPFLFKDADLHDDPPLPGTSGASFAELDHRHTQNLPETFPLLHRWADILAEYSRRDGLHRALFLEAYADLATTMKYYGDDEHNHMIAFNFELLTRGNQSTRPAHLRDTITGYLAALPGGATPNWVVGNHDNERVANRYGVEMVDAINLLTGVLPGIKVVYNGEELGMTDTFVRWDQTVDPSGLLLGPLHYRRGSRDPERSPMQWDDSLSAGFSTNRSTWLPVNPNYWWLNVAAQKSADTSHLKVFQALAEVRKDPVLVLGTCDVIVPDDNTLLVTRKYNDSVVALLVNMGSEVVSYTTESLFLPQGLDEDWRVVVASVHSGIPSGMMIKKGSANINLRPKAAVLLKSISTLQE